METAVLQKLARPASLAIMLFLSFPSQWLFQNTEPGALRKGEAYIFNTLVACLLICYARTCLSDPGKIPEDWHEKLGPESEPQLLVRPRWCRTCNAPKPPRAHHCKTCKRCIPKMDHHCVWTANCVSHVTFPHFVRFLFYSVAALWYLEYFLYQRCAFLWTRRHKPSYLGPSVFQLTHLFILVVANSLSLFMITLLFGRTAWSLALNTFTIEGWEIDRHETLLRRARTLGGFLTTPDGSKIRIERQEFPWDIGIWNNICQAMGSSNPLSWFWPFARSPSIESGIVFEHNNIEDPSKPWPPPDPDRMYRSTFKHAGEGSIKPLDVDSFRKRQEADFARYADIDNEYIIRRRPFHERLEDITDSPSYQNNNDNAIDSADESGSSDDLPNEARSPGASNDDRKGEESWQNKEGESLADFGVDEVADFYDEDDVPLSQILRRHKASAE